MDVAMWKYPNKMKKQSALEIGVAVVVYIMMG